jgi:hypothetical protein
MSLVLSPDLSRSPCASLPLSPDACNSLSLSLSGRSPAGTSGPGEPGHALAGRCPGHHESSRLLGLGRGRPQSERFRVWPQSERFRVSDRPGRPGRGVYTVTNRPSPAAIRSPEAKLAPGTERACDAAGRPRLPRRRPCRAGPAAGPELSQVGRLDGGSPSQGVDARSRGPGSLDSDWAAAIFKLPPSSGRHRDGPGRGDS